MADGATELVITPIGVPPFSARNLTQTLEPIQQAANFRRTVNGTLVNLAPTQFAKYRSVISGADHDTGAFQLVFPGMIVTVECIQEIGVKNGNVADQRPAVPGSERNSGDYSFYRPILTMMVTAGPTASWDEAAGVNTHSIELEEV